MDLFPRLQIVAIDIADYGSAYKESEKDAAVPSIVLCYVINQSIYYNVNNDMIYVVLGENKQYIHFIKSVSGL